MLAEVDETAELRLPQLWRVPRPHERRPGVDGRPRYAYAPVPLPPTDAEKERYRTRRLAPLLLASLISFGCLVTSQVLFLRTAPWLLVLAPLTVFTVAYYLISLAVNAFTRGFDLAAHRRLVRGWAPARRPSVDVFLPICGEPAHVLQNTWQNVREMAEHYPGPVRIHVLDDSPDETLSRMALAFGFNYLRRPNRGWFKKAGNMRHAYERTGGDFILVLDADFAPRRDLLDELLPYFDADPDVGIVQSPQFFRVNRGQGWLERGAGAVQELFYRSVQVSRQAHGAAICVGSCAVYRRAALDDIGGTTLIEHSEDVHTGFDLRRKGWRLRYVPVALAAGLCPAEVDSFFTQQYRWCAGSMSLLGSRKFWSTRMSLRARLSYCSGFLYYLHTALFTFVGPVVPLVMIYALPDRIGLANYLLIVPSVIYNMIIFPAWHRSAYRLEAWTVKLIYGWAHAFAIVDILRGRRMGWQSTGGTARKSKTRRLWFGLRWWTLGSALIWVAGALYRLADTGDLRFLPMFLGGMFLLTVVAQALLVNPLKDKSEVLV